MLAKINKKLYKKIALALSLCVLIVWSILGTGASLAWFSDSSPNITNIFNIAEFDLEIYYKSDDGSYKTVDSEQQVFDENAIYEPGYVQVVYLKVENKGTVPFNFTTAVNVTNYTLAKNVFGTSFNLQDYLRFGLLVADTEQQLDSLVNTRNQAEKVATERLGNYDYRTPTILNAGEENYLALIVRMPKEVTNEANFIGVTPPKVELGISVIATQIIQ